jgi:hypothetical protein
MTRVRVVQEGEAVKTNRASRKQPNIEEGVCAICQKDSAATATWDIRHCHLSCFAVGGVIVCPGCWDESSVIINSLCFVGVTLRMLAAWSTTPLDIPVDRRKLKLQKYRHGPQGMESCQGLATGYGKASKTHIHINNRVCPGHASNCFFRIASTLGIQRFTTLARATNQEWNSLVLVARAGGPRSGAPPPGYTYSFPILGRDEL